MTTELTTEQFIEILQNKEITKPENMSDFQHIYSFDNHQIPANFIIRKDSMRTFLLYIHTGEKYKEKGSNSKIGRLGRRVAKNYQVSVDKREDGEYKHWKLFFDSGYDDNLWQLKPNLIKALEELGLVEKKSNNKTIDQITKEFEEEIKSSKNDSQQKRLERLKQAIKKPTYTEAKVKTYNRNPDVVIEVLSRANGHCEYCQSPAPFKKDSDEEGFLEVHHIIPLAEGGDDTVENAVALCPNCHRHVHYGKNSFDIEKLRKIATPYNFTLRPEGA
ncbi:MAG: HNH endonuclease [Bacteroidales bacterium]|jgi:predicted HNH restriction endonuclease|nr:HNH endonuclease [Bacteroidales bacterium]